MSEQEPPEVEVAQDPPMPDYSKPPATPGPGYYRAGASEYSAVDRIIPTKNVKALLAYYFGVFAFVPCFTIPLAPAALICGILGLRECKRNPGLPGKGHAITGIVLGSVLLLACIAVAAILLLSSQSKGSS